MAEPITKQVAEPSPAVAEGGDLDALLQKEFRPKTDEAKEAVEKAVRTLAEQALAQTQMISADVVQSITAMIAALDTKLSEQINVILHHPDFQKLEGAWRGLHYLVNNTETDEMLKIRVLNISKTELGKTLKRYKGTAWDQSPIFKRVYEQEYGQFGGEPFGCMVGDYYFDHTPPDVELLGEMGKVSAAAHSPFIAGAGPTVMQMGTWQELADPRDLTKIFTTPEYAAWRSLRESDDSRYIGLAMPRFLSRLPYGAKSSPVPEFDNPDATANANLSARLPYLFAACRFAHYLKCIVRDKIGSFKERDEMQRWLNAWIMNYVDGDPVNSSETTKAKRPLSAAMVTVAEVEGNPGYYTSNFFLRPHYQLEGLTVSLRLVSRRS